LKPNNICILKQYQLYLTRYSNVMAQYKTVLLPSQQRTLIHLGENIRLARLRRDLSAAQVAERAGIGRSTLVKVEKGDEGVSIGIYLRALFVLGLDKDLLKVAEDDILGRRLQDARLTTKERASKRK
jgi:DNA-binding XRE family transcriptional regulator